MNLPMVVVPPVRLALTIEQQEQFVAQVAPFDLLDEEPVMLPRIEQALMLMCNFGVI